MHKGSLQKHLRAHIVSVKSLGNVAKTLHRPVQVLSQATQAFPPPPAGKMPELQQLIRQLEVDRQLLTHTFVPQQTVSEKTALPEQSGPDPCAPEPDFFQLALPQRPDSQQYVLLEPVVRRAGPKQYFLAVGPKNVVLKKSDSKMAVPPTCTSEHNNQSHASQQNHPQKSAPEKGASPVTLQPPPPHLPSNPSQEPENKQVSLHISYDTKLI